MGFWSAKSIEMRQKWSLPFALISALALTSACSKGFHTKEDQQGLTGLHSGDSSYKTNNLAPPSEAYKENYKQKYKENVTKDSSAQLVQSIGYFDNGSLQNASFLPAQAPGLLASPRHRRKHYSSFELQQVLLSAAEVVHKAYPKGSPAVVASLSKEHGGETNHASHQNGTDADVFYYSTEEGAPNEMLAGGRLVENFDAARTYLFLKAAVSTGRVMRVFMHEKIKQALCIHAKLIGDSTTKNETLRRIQGMKNKLDQRSNHSDHMHIRIYCPWNSVGACKNQTDIARDQGTNCETIPLDLSIH
jgi:murein endopeptidase